MMNIDMHGRVISAIPRPSLQLLSQPRNQYNDTQEDSADIEKSDYWLKHTGLRKPQMRTPQSLPSPKFTIYGQNKRLPNSSKKRILGKPPIAPNRSASRKPLGEIGNINTSLVQKGAKAPNKVSKPKNIKTEETKRLHVLPKNNKTQSKIPPSAQIKSIAANAVATKPCNSNTLLFVDQKSMSKEQSLLPKPDTKPFQTPAFDVKIFFNITETIIKKETIYLKKYEKNKAPENEFGFVKKPIKAEVLEDATKTNPLMGQATSNGTVLSQLTDLKKSECCFRNNIDENKVSNIVRKTSCLDMALSSEKEVPAVDLVPYIMKSVALVQQAQLTISRSSTMGRKWGSWANLLPGSGYNDFHT